MDVLREGFDPGVHLDELDVAEDLVHLLNTPVGDGCALPPEIRRHPRAEHLMADQYIAISTLDQAVQVRL